MSEKSIGLKKILPYIWPHLRKYKWSFWYNVFSYTIAVSLSHIIAPIVYKGIIDTITTASSPGDVRSNLLQLIVYLAITVLVYNILYRTGDFALAYCQSNVMRELNDDTLKRLQSKSYRFFTDRFAGSIIKSARRYVDAYEDMHDELSFKFLQVGIQIAGIFVVLFYIHTHLGLVFSGWFITFLIIVLAFNKRRMVLNQAEAYEDSKVTGKLADIVTNIVNVKVFARNKLERKRYANDTQIEHKARLKAWYFENAQWVAQGAMTAILHIVGTYVIVMLWLDGSISAGTVILFQIYVTGLTGRMWDLGSAIKNYEKAKADAFEMIELFEEPVEIQDSENPEKLKIKDGAVEFKDITFSHGEDKADVYTNFSLSIPAGQRIGLVGHSGAGKSTLSILLLRFKDLASGSIKIDGQDITKISQDDLRSQIAYVPQDPILFHRSLKENIAYGNPDATEEQIIKVAKKAHAHEFISALPQGYNTLVGERGVKLSGGERQRVAIARAMLKDAPILILDEATSSLDAISEKYIQEAFTELMKNRTTIVIAHRLSTIQKLDRIIVLEDGSIAEEGTHDKLLEKKGVYYGFWSHQTDGFIN